MLRLHEKIRLLSLILLTGLLTPVSQMSASEAVRTPRFGLSEKTEIYVDRSYGFTIALLEDFRLSSEQGDLLFFQSPNRPGTMIVRPRPGLSLRTVQATLRNGFDNETIVLTPTGSPTTLQLDGGQGLAMEVEGKLQGREVHGMLAGIFGDNDQGYMILVGSVHERWLGFRLDALNMLKSFAIKPIQSGFEHERWQQRLAGMRLIFFEDQGTQFVGGAHVGEYHFCSDGTFFLRSDTTSTESDGWGQYTYGSTSKSRGTWRVRLENYYPKVVLRDKRSVVRIIDIAESEGHVVLNGLPYQFAVNELCE